MHNKQWNPLTNSDTTNNLPCLHPPPPPQTHPAPDKTNSHRLDTRLVLPLAKPTYGLPNATPLVYPPAPVAYRVVAAVWVSKIV